jgi:hypothetical protein
MTFNKLIFIYFELIIIVKNQFIEKEFWNKSRQNEKNWNYTPL